MVIFHVRCDRWCLTRTIFLVFIIHSMHSLKDTQFWLCYFLFIVPMLKNDLKLCVNHQFIAPSLYNQITQLIFITDIFRPRIKCTTLFGGTLCLCEVSRFLSKFLTDLAGGCQVIRWGPETIFAGASGQVLPLPSRVAWPVFSCAYYFQVSATQARKVIVFQTIVCFAFWRIFYF